MSNVKIFTSHCFTFGRDNKFAIPTMRTYINEWWKNFFLINNAVSSRLTLFQSGKLTLQNRTHPMVFDLSSFDLVVPPNNIHFNDSSFLICRTALKIYKRYSWTCPLLSRFLRHQHSVDWGPHFHTVAERMSEKFEEHSCGWRIAPSSSLPNPQLKQLRYGWLSL